MAYPERVAVLGDDKGAHVRVDGWSLEGYRAKIVVLRWQSDS